MRPNPLSFRSTKTRKTHAYIFTHLYSPREKNFFFAQNQYFHPSVIKKNPQPQPKGSTERGKFKTPDTHSQIHIHTLQNDRPIPRCQLPQRSQYQHMACSGDIRKQHAFVSKLQPRTSLHSIPSPLTFFFSLFLSFFLSLILLPPFPTRHQIHQLKTA